MMVTFDAERIWPIREAQTETQTVRPRAMREILPELLKGYAHLLPDTSPVSQAGSHKGELAGATFTAQTRRAS